MVLIIPSVAFASWWNPLSWNIFSFLHKKEVIPQVQVEVQKTPEEKINELQKQLDDLKKQQPTSTSATTIPAIKEVKKTAPVDNSAIIKKQVEATLKAKADQDALIAKQKADEQTRIDALKAESDRQAQLEANRIKEEELEVQKEANAKIEAKQEKLDAINLEIANLNAKYAKDSAELKLNTGGSFGGAMNSNLSNLQTKYIDDYNALMAEFQQVKYSD